MDSFEIEKAVGDILEKHCYHCKILSGFYYAWLVAEESLITFFYYEEDDAWVDEDCDPITLVKYNYREKKVVFSLESNGDAKIIVEDIKAGVFDHYFSEIE